MSSVTFLQFNVKDVPVQNWQDVYLVLQENQKNNVLLYKMKRKNQNFQFDTFIKPKTLYKYQYRIQEQNKIVKEEEGCRTLSYEYNDIQDQWNLKLIKLRIQTKQQEIMKTLKINVNQKKQGENIINKHTLQLKKVMYNNKPFYEQTILVNTAQSSLDLQFIFNAVKYDTNRNEQKYTKKKTYQYNNFIKVGNQLILEISDEEFDQISRKPQCEEIRKSLLNPHLELSNEKVQNLQQIFENSIRYFRENLEIKDQQIKQLKLEKLEQEEIIFFNYQDSFQQDPINVCFSQFNKIVEDYKKDTKSFLSQYNQELQDNESIMQESTIKDYNEKISNKEKTIKTLQEKIKQLKSSIRYNVQIVQDLEDKISNFKKQLKTQKQRIGELKEQLIKANQQNQRKASQKDKFEQQIKEYDVEIEWYKKKNKDLEKQNQITFEEKEKISLEKQAIDDQLLSTTNEIQNYIQKQRAYEEQLKNAEQLIGQYQAASANEANLIKESRNILVQLIFQNLTDLKDIINFHKEPDIKADTENIKNQLSQIELKLKNFVDEKTTLSQVEEHFQSQVLKQLSYLCSSDRIKQNERKQINDNQNCLNQIIQVLKKFDKIIEIMLRLQADEILLQHQPNEISIQSVFLFQA